MRILHLLNHVRDVGNGIVNNTVDLACLQAATGHDVAVAASPGSFFKLLNEYGVHFIRLEQRRSPLSLARALYRYSTILRGFRPDIVHAHMVTGILLAFALRLNHRYTIVSTVHNEFQRSAILMGLANRVTTGSVAVAESMRHRGIPARKFRVVILGTLDGPRARRSMPAIAPQLERPAIITVSGLYRRKGIDVVIDAFSRLEARFPSSHLYIVGEGPDRETFELQARAARGGDRIHFTGFEPVPNRFLRESDIFVLASRSETFGMAITEARAAGCAVIGSRVGGIPEALDGGTAGQLVNVNDSVALADSMASLLRDPALLERWRAAAKNGIERFSAARYCADMLAVYEETRANASGGTMI